MFRRGTATWPLPPVGGRSRARGRLIRLRLLDGGDVERQRDLVADEHVDAA
jgi:hypothetical protein